MSYSNTNQIAHLVADRLRRDPLRIVVALVMLAMALATALHFRGALSGAGSGAPGGSPTATLPAEGVFESCSLDTEMPTCLGRLHAMHQGGMQVVVITAWAGSLDSLRAYAAAAQSLGMSVIWELSDPSWWRDPATSTGAAGQFPAFATGCGCDQNGPLLCVHDPVAGRAAGDLWLLRRGRQHALGGGSSRSCVVRLTDQSARSATYRDDRGLRPATGGFLPGDRRRDRRGALPG